MSLKIIQYIDGRYYVRKGTKFFGYKYLDIDGHYWWSYTNIRYCLTTKENAEKLLKYFKNK